MKIDAQPMFLRQSDDYYWQHQSQLQQSEISFNQLIHENKTHLTREDSPSVKVAVTPSAPIKASPHSLRVTIVIEKCMPTSMHLTQWDLEQLITHLAKSASAIVSPDVSEPRASGSVPLTFPLSNGRSSDSASPAFASPFKSHQLFFDGNRVELAFNTTQLSKPQITELQRFIQQWLSKKGYALKQLTLNGVQQ